MTPDAARPITPDGAPPDIPDYTIAHLSDTHLMPAGERYNGAVDADAALVAAAAVLAAAASHGARPDALIVSGDLTDTGDPDAYARLHRTLAPLADEIVYATGNHDVRTQFHASLLDRPGETGPLLQVRRIRGLRIVALDSTIPGAGHGRLTDDHLAALTAELAAPADDGTVLVLHHAPLPPPSPLLTFFALERPSRQALADAVAGTDVRLILAGHHHLAGSGQLGGIPVAVAGSTAIRTDPLAPPGHERTTASGSFNLVRLYPESVAVSVIPLDDAPQVFDLDAGACARIIADNGGPAAH